MIALSPFIIGIPIGIVMTAPVGPVNIMCLQKVLRHGFVTGVIVATGAVIADLVYALMAVLGVTAIIHSIEHYATFLEWGGGLLLLVYGIHTWRKVPHFSRERDEGTAKPITCLMTSFMLTVTNPGTIFGFLAIFGSLGDMIPEQGDWNGIVLLLAGVVTGAFGWWFILISVTNRVRTRLDETWLRRISRLGSALILSFAAVLLGRAIAASAKALAML
ncbi:LysE family translocator [Coralliovum pocilloporae]|uniref:LysE family translocator n=1 Tax=Coralliovum pocilloporae TaxID=3066369 RepID=UPI003307950D